MQWSRKFYSVVINICTKFFKAFRLRSFTNFWHRSVLEKKRQDLFSITLFFNLQFSKHSSQAKRREQFWAFSLILCSLFVFIWKKKKRKSFQTFFRGSLIKAIAQSNWSMFFRYTYISVSFSRSEVVLPLSSR